MRLLLGACVRSDQIHQKRIQADKRRKRQLAMGFLEAQSCKRTDAAYVRLSSVRLFTRAYLLPTGLRSGCRTWGIVRVFFNWRGWRVRASLGCLGSVISNILIPVTVDVPNLGERYC